MLYSNAAAAVPIVNNINYCTNMTATIGSFTNGSMTISFTNLVLQPSGTPFSLSDSFSVSEAATIFNALFTIYNNRLTNYNSQLAALSG